MKALEKKIGYRFSDPKLLQTALTHSSYANENGCPSYERLEFLGDSYLGFITARFLYRRYPDFPEGKLSKIRSELVCETALHRVALNLGLSDYLILGKGEQQSGGRERASILADVVEAVIAAMILDGAPETAERFILETILSEDAINALSTVHDYKTELQEQIQKDPNAVIEYRLIGESGPDHRKSFTFGVFVNGELLGQGTGKTKKAAEQSAAGAALRLEG